MSATWAKVVDLVRLVEPELCRTGARKIMLEHRDRMIVAPGSRGAHHAYQGGYLVHVLDCMEGVRALHGLLSPLPFSLSSALLVMLLHDLEKPFRYVEPFDPLACGTKIERRQFRERLIAGAGIALTVAEAEAMRHVEGEGDDYLPGDRAMGPLAALCHMTDVASARIFFDGVPEGAAWRR